jgi:hypothetical protein
LFCIFGLVFRCGQIVEETRSNYQKGKYEIKISIFQFLYFGQLNFLSGENDLFSFHF